MSTKKRIGNDLNITWSVLKKDRTAYPINSEILDVYMVVNHCRVDISSISVSGNRISFTYYGKDQKQTGSYALVLIENKGQSNMITHDIKDAFILVPHSWQEEYDSEPDNVFVESVLNNDIIVPDEETITSDQYTGVIGLKNRTYDESEPNGLGYKILSKDIPFAEQVTAANTIYEIRYNFDLGEQSVTLPSRSTLLFKGGKISSGTLEGNNSRLEMGDYDHVFNAVILSGDFDCDGISIFNFGVDTESEGSNSSIITNFVDPSLSATGITLFVPKGDVRFDVPIVLSGSYDIDCKGRFLYTGEAGPLNALTIGGSDRNSYKSYRIKLSNAHDYNDNYTQSGDDWIIPDFYGLVIKNLHTSDVELPYVSGFPYNVLLLAENVPFAYNTIHLGYNGGYIYTNLVLKATGSGYINENLFLGGRFAIVSSCVVKSISKAVVLQSELSEINNNVFIKPCVEGHETGFDFSNARYNTVIGARTEGNTYNSKFASGTFGNVVLSGYMAGSTKNGSATANLSTSVAAIINATMQIILDEPLMLFGGPGNSNLIQFLNNQTLGKDTTRSRRAVGVVVDVSVYKTIRFCHDVSARLLIAPVDAEGNVITVTSTTDVVTNVGWQTENGYLKSGADAYMRDVTFTDAVSRVFIGTMGFSDASRVQLSVKVPNTALSGVLQPSSAMVIYPYEPGIVASVPTSATNVTLGYKLYVTSLNKFIWWNGTEWIDSTGTAV